MLPNIKLSIDEDRDGVIDRNEAMTAEIVYEIELRDRKDKTQKALAWTAMISMIVLSVVLFMPWMTDARVNALGNLLGLFYMAQMGVVGAYMGASAYSSNRAMDRINNPAYRYSTAVKKDLGTPMFDKAKDD